MQAEHCVVFSYQSDIKCLRITKLDNSEREINKAQLYNLNYETSC